MTDDRSRIPEFYKRSIGERLELMRERSLLDEEDYRTLLRGRQVMAADSADRLVENVIGVFSLPLGIGLNFRINDKPYAIPLVVEEPSIIAGLSSAAKVVGQAGGFEAESTEPILIGQIQVVKIKNSAQAKQAVLQRKDEILNLADSLHPKMVARGGGARDVEVIIHPGTAYGDMVIVHLLVDTCDAMGANLVNSMCEGVAPLIEKITGGEVFLRILSNLTDRALVRARAVIPVELLGGQGTAGEDVRDGIVLAAEFAHVDPYRAATNNKGVLNGIDALALATGNDWRAVEAGAHAWAARGSHYTSLTHWYRSESGDLVGSIELPLKVGTVGGPLQSNPAVGINLRILGVESARELACVMGAVGLAQNFAALRALVTDGIQQGHMTLHARSVAMAAGATPESFERVVEKLIESGEIKVWKAENIVAEMQERSRQPGSIADNEDPALASAHGKVILLGEHAVVYGSHAIAAPIPLAIQAKVDDADEGVHLIIPAWGVEERCDLGRTPPDSMQESTGLILDHLGLRDRAMRVEVFPHVPRAMGMGASAAVAVAVIRALMTKYDLELSDEEVCALAFESEKVAHGTPSGIDNTLATYGRFILFKRGEPPYRRELNVLKPIPIVLGLTGIASLTAKMVARVRSAWKRNEALYERIFAEIDSLTLAAVTAIESYDLDQLGELMNVNQGLLNALQVSSREIEELVQVAREAGAVGAKLTGGGGGGTMVALCPDNSGAVAKAIRRAGYQAIATQIG
ncbi:MAG: hydroxymethylglutaryl-CoA reductase, degradative [Myxococcota bacterium]